MNDDLNNNELKDEQLPVLQLPEGVSAHDIAKLINNVLLERVLCEECPWAQWILLGALEILADRGAPGLDGHSLDILQAMDNKAITNHGNKELRHFKYDMDITSPLYGDEKACSKEMKDFEVQVTPKIMKITSSKWVQVQICKTRNRGTQVCQEYADCGTQSMGDFLTKEETTQREVKNVGTQTLMTHYRDEGTQYNDWKLLGDSSWRLIPISNVPELKAFRTSASSMDEGFTEGENNELNGSFPSTNEMNVFTRKQKDSIRLFHGRPLIGKGSGKQAADIPPNAINNEHIILSSDPRVGTKKVKV